ncbi:MAG: hypothetical protein PUG60_07205 [Lachnospiraceae bacterium]|nr:hypothetical protein [Lachnospiraceae bacterium]MDY4970461.1 hypothetical protein [Lachnospiraceae bacterium]
MRFENSSSHEVYEITSFFTEEDQIPYLNVNKGFPLRCGVAVKDKKEYFIKFVLLGECSEKSLREAQAAFEREIRFQMRYPYIVYVESLDFYKLRISEEEEKPEFSDFLQTAEKLEKKQSGLSALCLMEEYVQGDRLGDVYAADAEEVPEEILFRHMHQLLNGMCAYYDRYRTDPLLHRDIKPANVIISPDLRKCTYIDFDIAHPSGSTGTKSRGFFGKGTPGYAHPRQTAAGAGVSDIRIDFYGLGMTFLYMLTGTDYMRMVTGLSEEEINNWEYLTSPVYYPCLYKVQRTKLLRNGKPVFQEPRYDGLISLIDQMIADDTETGKRLCRNPRELLKYFEEYLRSVYGKQYRSLFKDGLLLSGNTDEACKTAVIQVYSYQKGARIIRMGMNSVLSIPDDCGKEMLLVYTTDHKVFYQMTGQNIVPAENAPASEKGAGVLTGRGFEFTIADRKYRLKLVRMVEEE